MSSSPAAEASASQGVNIQPLATTQELPSSTSKSTPATHISQVQPHASFFRVSRPNEVPKRRPSSFVSASSGIHNRFMDAIHGAPLTRQLSITSASDVSSIAARRMHNGIGVTHSREPLLPLSAIHKPPAQTGAAESPAPSAASAGKVRSSLEKIFKRGTSADSIATSPRPNSLQPQMAASENEMHQPRSSSPQRDSYFPSQSVPERPVAPSPRPSSRHAHFAPIPPPDATPFVPVVSPMTGKPLRNYEGYPSQNTFFFRGHLLTGGDSPIPFIGSFILVLGIAGTWFATTCVWWWKNESPAIAAVGAYMCLITVASMLATALRDPGILPRDLDPDPPYPAVSPSDGSPRVPLPRELRIGENIVHVKYCITCKTYRPPRSSHCKSCDNCIDGCDHHCQWVNNCVGRRNYTSFITFLVTASLTLALVIVTAALHLFILTQRDHVDFQSALSDAPGSAVAFSLGIIVIWPLLALMGYHVRLLLLNITTIEQVRNKFHATLVPGPTPPNPFSLGRWYRNVAYLVCRPAGYTWIEASAVKMEDRRLINPGLFEDDSDGEE